MQQKIARFKVGRRLGSGNQGTVFLCMDPELERSVAIKVLDKTVLGSQEAAASFHREARSMSKIQHPNIVSIYEAGRHGGVPFLVFEYVEGQLLSEMSAPGTEPGAVMDLFQGMLEGMRRAHQQGIVHRDLKPANIIISGEGIPKIMDFGIARIISGNRDLDTRLIGTPRYMAPEYIEQGMVGTQTDVFALGLILSEMLSGEPVFQGSSQQTVLNAIVNESVDPPSRSNPEIDERLDRIVLKALEKDPSARFTDAGEFLSALREYRDARGAVAVASASGKGTIEFLLRRMQRKSDFPALSNSIRTINAMTSSSNQDVGDVAKVIVKDFALTSKLLKVVNSAYFGHFAGKIGTVSRAVVVLGMQPIRSLAASLIFFEHLSDKSQAAEMQAMTAGALYSAVLAGNLAADIDPENREEHFLSAMLQNLGAIIVTYYLNDEAREIRRLVAQQDMPADKAQRMVLGISFEDVGIGIAGQWNFPDDIRHSLKPLPLDAGVKAPKTLAERRRAVSSFANETAQWIGSEGQDQAALKCLLERFGDALDLNGKKLNKLLSSSTKEFLKLVQHAAIGTQIDPFVRRLRGHLDSSAGSKAAEGVAGPSDTSPIAAGGARQILNDMPETNGDSESLLMAGLQEVTNLLITQPGLPQLCNVVLETMYRAMAFQRIIICLKDRSGTQIEAKTGFGNDLNSFRKDFRFPLAWNSDVFHAALRKNVDVYISDTSDPRIRKDLPEWFKKVSNAGSFLVFPLVVNTRPLGLIYGDHPSADGLQMTGNTLNLLKSLRNQIILGFRERM